MLNKSIKQYCQKTHLTTHKGRRGVGPSTMSSINHDRCNISSYPLPSSSSSSTHLRVPTNNHADRVDHDHHQQSTPANPIAKLNRLVERAGFVVGTNNEVFDVEPCSPVMTQQRSHHESFNPSFKHHHHNATTGYVGTGYQLPCQSPAGTSVTITAMSESKVNYNTYQTSSDESLFDECCANNNNNNNEDEMSSGFYEGEDCVIADFLASTTGHHQQCCDEVPGTVEDVDDYPYLFLPSVASDAFCWPPAPPPSSFEPTNMAFLLASNKNEYGVSSSSSMTGEQQPEDNSFSSSRRVKDHRVQTNLALFGQHELVSTSGHLASPSRSSISSTPSEAALDPFLDMTANNSPQSTSRAWQHQTRSFENPAGKHSMVWNCG